MYLKACSIKAKQIKFSVLVLILQGFLICLFNSCAHVVAPGGGKIDSEAPKFIAAEPANFSKNFQAKSIKITFDEFIRFNDLQSKLVISPIPEEEPEIEVKGKSIRILLNGKLLPNTTYSINFGNAIQDIHENNELENFKYVFSTGEFLDSLSLSGIVLSAKDLKAEKGVLVMLYKENEDSIPLKEKPFYFSKSNEEGLFSLGNLAAGKYKVFGLKDLNSNFLFDLPNESIAFLDTLLQIDTNKLNIKLHLFVEPYKKQLLLRSTSDHFGKVTFIYSKSAKILSIQTADTVPLPTFDFIESIASKDTFTYWFGNPSSDSLRWYVQEESRLDTVLFVMKKTASKGTKKQAPFKLVGGLNVNSALPGRLPEFGFNYPIQSIDTSMIRFTSDSIPVAFDSPIFLDSVHRKVGLGPKLKEEKNYTMIAFPGAFKDIFGMTNDTLRSEFGIKKEKEFGSLLFSINPEQKGNYILQLLDEKGIVLKEDKIEGNKKLIYKQLLPAKYSIKLIFDANMNGLWDTGNYLENRQAEKVLFFPKSLVVRADWENEMEWKP